MPTDVTPLVALALLAVGVLFGLGFHLAAVVVSAMQSGTASRGATICILLAAVIVIVALAL